METKFKTVGEAPYLPSPKKEINLYEKLDIHDWNPIFQIKYGIEFSFIILEKRKQLGYRIKMYLKKRYLEIVILCMTLKITKMDCVCFFDTAIYNKRN